MLEEPLRVFCSVAPEDEALCSQLRDHLRLLERQRVLDVWYVRLVTGGMDWATEIDAQLASASIILLLISSSFFASDYCYGVEMQAALRRHKANEARIIPIVLRPVDWKTAPFAHLVALPDTGKPLTEWRNRDAAFSNIVAGIRRVVEELTSSSEQRPSAPQAQVWNVPHSRNPHFTGREELLDRLDQQLSPEVPNNLTASRRAALTQPQAIKGLGGIGKTQIAVEYAYRSRKRDRYTHIFWVNAASEEALITSFAALAELLPSFPAKNETDQRKLVATIKRWLEQCKQPWLLIFDNADDIALVRDYLPQQGNGSILLTTRADAVGSLATSMEVETMGFVEGTHFLLRRAQRFAHASDEEINEAGNIVVALDHFPLALDQAGAYIEETKCRFGDYLLAYRDHRKALLARRGTQATSYPDPVATTWSLSFDKVKQANPAAAEFLQLCAFLAPDHIPEELIRNSASHWPPLLQQATTDLFTFNQMIEELLKFSLIKRFIEDHMLSIHRLVQAVQMDTMEPDEQRTWAERIVRAVNTAFPRDPKVEVATWPQCLRYLEQAQVCDALIQHHMLMLPEAADLLDRTGTYLHEHASYIIAEPLFQHALAIREQELGSTHLDTASSFDLLGQLYQHQGKYKEAEPLLLQALTIREQGLGSTHPNIVQSLSNLGDFYARQGKYKKAEQLLQRALAICEQVLGPTDPDTASSLNHLGWLYSLYTKHKEAELAFQRAMEINEQIYGLAHPITISDLDALGWIYSKQTRYEEAEPLIQQALVTREQLLGPIHPDTAQSLNHLGWLFWCRGRHKEAEPLFQRALAVCKQSLDPIHPEPAFSLLCLGMLCSDQGKYEEAEPFYQQAIAIYEQVFGPTSEDAGKALGAYAVLLLKRWRIIKAVKTLIRALNALGMRLTILSVVVTLRIYVKRVSVIFRIR